MMGGVGGADLPQLRSAAGQAAPPELLPALFAVGSRQPVRPGQMIIAAGSGSAEVYVVLSGTVRATLFTATGREVVMRDQGPGSFFGDLAAIDGGLRSASVVAVADGLLLAVAGPAFRQLMSATPEVAGWFARHLAAQVRSLTARVLELSTLTVRTRLHCHLLRLAASAGVTDNQAIIDPMPTHEMLATVLGTHREAVTRELSFLSARGIVGKAPRRLHIIDVEQLSQLVRQAVGDTAPMVSDV